MKTHARRFSALPLHPQSRDLATPLINDASLDRFRHRSMMPDSCVRSWRRHWTVWKSHTIRQTSSESGAAEMGSQRVSLAPGGASVPVPTSTKYAALLINDEYDNPGH
jgi:hypothetical protein